MSTQGLDGLLGALRDLAVAFEDASADHPPLLHELLVSHFPRLETGSWEEFLGNSYYPRLILGKDGVLYRAGYPASDWGEEWHEVFPDNQRCGRFHGHGEEMAEFHRLAGQGYDLMRAIAASPEAADTGLPEAIRDPGFRPPWYGRNLPFDLAPSGSRFPYEERGRYGWIDLVYGTARLYPTICHLRVHRFGDLEEIREHHHYPDVYHSVAFATEFNVEVLASRELDIFTLSAEVIELWLAEPRPIEIPLPVSINLRSLVGGSVPGLEGGVPLDPSIQRPTRDEVERELRWGEVVLKRYKKAAETQTTILAAFEEDGWPAVIDGPLPGTQVVPTKRLGDTVRALNKDMLRPGVIQFERWGGSEKQVRWRRTF